MNVSTRILTMLVACVLVASSCSQPEPDVSPTPVDGAPAELSASEPPPVPLIEPAPAPPTDTTEDPDAAGAASPADRANGAEEPAPSEDGASTAPAEQPAPEPEDVVLLAVGDRQGDHGAQGPAYADLTALELVSSGNDAEVTLRLGAALPLPPGEGEVMLVSVDIGDGDDGYQLFVIGNADGWTAYLYSERREGFVPYPGTFVISGSTMRLAVPWNAIGSPTRAPVRARVEWSRDEGGLLAALNPASDDRLDGQPHTFDRNP